MPSALRRDIPLSPKTTSRLSQAIGHGLAKRTQQNYASAVSRFIDFCDSEHIDQSLRFPAAEFVLCAFVGSLAGVKSGSTAANAIAGLKTWHNLHGQPWSGGYLLSHVLRGSDILTPPASRRPPRPPVTINMLETLAVDLDLSVPFDVAVHAAALTIFFAQCRLGEVLATSRRIHNPLTHPSRSSLSPLLNGIPSVELHLPRTKTNQALGQTVYLTAQQDLVCPLKALKAHFATNADISPDDHIFAYRTNGITKRLTKEDFLLRCNEIWVRRGFSRVSGHAFRIGGTHAFLAAGVPDDVVKKLGRWSSDAFLRYWRGLGNIAQIHTSNLHTRKTDTIPGQRPPRGRGLPRAGGSVPQRR